jgi:thiol-disulfide isomerase/thioredoxin
MISVGPFSIRIVVITLATMVAWLVARLLARRLPDSAAKSASGLILDAFLVGLVIGRTAFVLVWWKDYVATPWSILAVGDGGFYAAAGVPAAVAWVWWKTRREQPLRKPVYAGILAGLLAWGGGSGALVLLHGSAPSLPALELSTIDSEPVALASFAGQPIVVNLWATWCPPCRREMPVFVQAEADYPGIAFVMINQGESAATITAFLKEEGLELDHVLLDTASLAMREAGSRGLPTTLFFDAQGRMVHSHMGELTMPSLKSTVKSHFGQ